MFEVLNIFIFGKFSIIALLVLVIRRDDDSKGVNKIHKSVDVYL